MDAVQVTGADSLHSSVLCKFSRVNLMPRMLGGFLPCSKTLTPREAVVTAFFGGVFPVLLPDNMSTVVTKADPIAPILNGFVEEGKLTSWGWSTHVVGGRFRALQTMTAPDMKSLMKARGESIEAIYAEDNEAGAEFSDICGPHVDYMWDIQLESS